MQAMENQRLFEAIYADEIEETNLCHANQAELPAYLEAEFKGENVAARYPALYAQIQTCATCGAAYAELKALFGLETAGQWVQPPVAAHFNFAYLDQAAQATPVRQPTAEAATWRLDDLGRLIVALSAEFMRLLQAPTPQLAGLKTGGHPLLFELSAPALVADLQVTLTARPIRQAPTHCTITVLVERPSRGGWPHLAGAQVTLKLGEQAAQTQTTDAFGKAIFAGIAQEALAQTVIEITPVAPDPSLDPPSG